MKSNTYHHNSDVINCSVASYDIEDLNNLNASQLATYLYCMIFFVKTQKHRDKRTKWQTIDKFTRKRQKKKRDKENATIKDIDELYLGEIGKS